MKIVLATGGSGGHIFPALKVAEQLRRMDHETILVGVFGEASKRIREEGFSCFNLSARSLSFSSWSAPWESSLYMLKALVESFQILKNFRPHRVCGFGGYGAFPVVCAASLLGHPAMIHEQNVVPGRANRILSSWVGKIAITFEESQRYFHPSRTVWTGCPAHAQKSPLGKKELLLRFGLDEKRLTILVLGGSQGSHRINAEFIKAIPLLREHLDFQVIHIGGKNDHAQLGDFYGNCGIKFRLFDFLEEIGTAYQAADLVVARCGALTILEISKFQLPAILIPYPFAGGHQKENAKLLSESPIAKIIEEKDLTPQLLVEGIKDLWAHRLNRQEIAQRVRNIFIPEAEVRLAREIVSLK